MHRIWMAAATTAGIILAAPVMATEPVPLTLRAADGLAISADYYRTVHPKALILLFHQAGSGKGEYATIAPRLNAAGYSALAIDQRSGGDMFGTNETAAQFGHKADYMDAQQDLEAALAWGRQQHLPIALWGSSYSAALVFLLAAEHPVDVKAVLAFSPGEYLDHKDMVRRAAARVHAPIYVTFAPDADEAASAKAILAASPATVKIAYAPPVGVHGSSTLIAARDPQGTAANWRVVLAFLGRIFG